MRDSSFFSIALICALATSSQSVPSAVCPRTNGSKVMVTSGSTEYVMPVPANKIQFSVIGPDQQLGCIQLRGKYSMCLPCNFPVNKIEVTREAGICSFNISGRTDLLYNKHGDGPLTVLPPAQIFDVECGLLAQVEPSSL